MKKNIRGITIISLVITIIIIIILAAISINMILGKNGIIYKATIAKQEHDIAQITETLELYKAPVAIDNQNGVKLEDYLEYLQKIKDDGTAKYKIQVEEVDKIQGYAYIIVEDKYEYLLEQEDNGNLLIKYLGKADDKLPRIVNINIINITETQFDISLITKYAEDCTFIIEDMQGNIQQELTLENIESTCEHTFTGLQENSEYKLIVIAKNKKRRSNR